MGLGEDPTSIVEIQTKRERHVAAVHARRTRDTGAELHRDVLENLLDQPRFRQLPHPTSLAHPHDSVKMREFRLGEPGCLCLSADQNNGHAVVPFVAGVFVEWTIRVKPILS